MAPQCRGWGEAWAPKLTFRGGIPHWPDPWVGPFISCLRDQPRVLLQEFISFNTNQSIHSQRLIPSKKYTPVKTFSGLIRAEAGRVPGHASRTGSMVCPGRPRRMFSSHVGSLAQIFGAPACGPHREERALPQEDRMKRGPGGSALPPQPPAAPWRDAPAHPKNCPPTRCPHGPRLCPKASGTWSGGPGGQPTGGGDGDSVTHGHTISRLGVLSPWQGKLRRSWTEAAAPHLRRKPRDGDHSRV